MGWLGALVALSMSVGALCALLWVNVVRLPSYEVRADGHAVIDDQGLASIISADASFSVLGLVAGAVLGTAAWYWFRRLGWPVAFLAVGAGLVAGITCWWLGTIAGPGTFEERMAAAQAGDVVPLGLGVSSPSALAFWTFAAAAVPLFAASLTPERRPALPTTRRRRRQARADDESVMDEAGIARR